ncbi:MAG: hypothetical protein NWE82_02405, partial [Candidatus Bathyarchaeota archaeon]|nr:hypothetical protein [Candidatus Bathyarchaeota archaeon]
MLSESNPSSPRRVRGWLLDLYPSAFGQMTVWLIGDGDSRVRLVDEFQPRIYVSGGEEDLERLRARFFGNRLIASCSFVSKWASPTDTARSRVLEVVVKDCRRVPFLVREVLELGGYLRYHVHNCDLRSEQAYLYSRDIFPLAFLEVEVEAERLTYHLLDSVESVDYEVPPLRIMRVRVDVAKKGKIASFADPLDRVVVSQGGEETIMDSGDERAKLLGFVDVVWNLDPDVLVTRGGDSYIFPYLARKALLNDVMNRLVLGREDTPLAVGRRRGTTFFSYGRTYYRAPTR